MVKSKNMKRRRAKKRAAKRHLKNSWKEYSNRDRHNPPKK